MYVFTFYNHLESTVIDYVLVHKDIINSISNMCVCDFNEWSVRPRSNSFHYEQFTL